jgi:hypothetical protein
MIHLLPAVSLLGLGGWLRTKIKRYLRHIFTHAERKSSKIIPDDLL